MIHLTFTGYYAGTPLCGCERNSEDTFLHAVYAPKAMINGEDKTVCKECLKVWNESEDDSED